MRKNNPLFLLILFLALPVFGNDVSTEIDQNNKLVINYLFPMSEREDISESLEKGSSAEITLQIRIYKKDFRFLTVFDELVCSEDLVITGRWDILSGSYIITGNKGLIDSYEDEQQFFENFLHTHTKLDPECDIFSDLSSYYIRFKAILIKRVYVEPFHIFQFFDYRNRVSTGWTKFDLIREENAH